MIALTPFDTVSATPAPASPSASETLLALQGGSLFALQDGSYLSLGGGAFYRDDFVMRDVERRLNASGVLDRVVRGAGPREFPLSGQPGRYCWFDRSGFRETASGASKITDRVVTYTLWLAVRRQDPAERSDLLVQIESQVQNLLNRVSLAGITYPVKTTLGQGVKDLAGDDESRVRMSGSFQYFLVDGGSGRETSDPT